jgi:acetyltransferase-like isoleucine patch superfamily enzyme
MRSDSNKRVPFEDPISYLPRALSKLYSTWLSRTYPFASLGRHLSVHYTFTMNRVMAPRIKLGNSVTMGKDVWLNIIPEATDEVNIVIDDRCRIAAWSWISAKNHIHLEQDVNVEPSVLIMDHGHSYELTHLPIKNQIATEGGRIRIERGCSIGAGTTIVCAQGNLVLGQYCVVTPSSVVLRSMPPYSVVGGNPARVIERLDPSQINPELASRLSEEVSLQSHTVDTPVPVPGSDSVKLG